MVANAKLDANHEPRDLARRRRIRKALDKWLLTLLGIVVLIPFLFPFAWMLLGSFKREVDFTAYPPVWIFEPTMTNYVKVLVDNDFGTFALNSTIVATATTVLALLLGIPGAYAVARYRRNGFAMVVLASRMAPGIAFLIPWFVMFVHLKLTNTYIALVTSHLIVSLPIVLWMMIGFIEAVPIEIEQAALVDGCTVWGVLGRVVVPLSLPGIAASGILSFIFSWNNFLYSVVLAGDATKTLPVAVFSFLSYQSINWGSLSAAACVITLPVILLALMVQRYIVQGLAAGGVSG
ncbi:MAG: carbohydrate ABC transporter permease [Dehalococcoidales bacterium]|nr:carbohydrate ABC transporter permease [Dehalococcoidales bacterium]